jgi:polar amino acid transport system substrate-binding protein
MTAYKQARYKILIAAFLLFSFGTSKAECLLTSPWEPWEPYQSVDQTGKVTGLDIDLVTAIFESAGCSVDFQKRPWKRTLLEVKMGRLDIAPGASFSKEREEFAYFSDAYRNEVMSFFVLKENLSKYNFSTLEEIIGTDLSIGVVRGYHYGEQFETVRKDKRNKVNIQESGADETNLKKLLKGRVDMAVIDTYTGFFLLKQLGIDKKIVKHSVLVNSNEIHVMVSKISPTKGVVKKFNAGLAAIKASGQYQKIVDRYLD